MKITSVVRNVRFSPGQYRLIEAKASDLGMSVAAFIRLAAVKASGQRKEKTEEHESLKALVG